ncbi:hypothetical protein [Rubritalea sp.]|uniref:hypothetical protein n=1 Tax=Rubritalea sp. TaxID=2109375 RepID=UPI003EF8AF88
MESNPYISPTTKAIKAFVSSDGVESTARLRDIVLKWEKLRVIYNLVLLLPGLGVTLYAANKWGSSMSEMLSSVIPFAIMANLCFFLGPLSELYIAAIWQINDSRMIRRWSFGLGLVGSLLIIMITFWAV